MPRKSHKHRKTRKHSYKHRGGNTMLMTHGRGKKGQYGGNYSSASTYGSYVNGSGPEQYDRTFSLASPYANRVGSEYVGAQGQWAQQPNTPSNQQLSLIQSAGRRRRYGKKGGFLGPVLNEAVVPATLLALQQNYGRRGNKTLKNRFSRRV
jgi:hypothetical protein